MRLPLSLAVVGVAAAAAAAAQGTDDGLGVLAEYGLDDGIRRTLEKRGVSSKIDVGFMSDSDINGLWWESVPSVKRAALRVARDEIDADRREVARRRRRRETAYDRVASWLLATAETAVRGLCLGSGASFLYETTANRGFFQLPQGAELDQAIRAASYRAVAMGSATALACLGASMLVPHQLRASWLQ